MPTAIPLSGKRLLARVGASVLLEVAGCSSTEPTTLPLAGKRLLVRVKPSVDLEGARCYKELPARTPVATVLATTAHARGFRFLRCENIIFRF